LGQGSCRFRKHNLSEILGFLRARDAPKQPMHAIMVRVVKGPKQIGFRCRFRQHDQFWQLTVRGALRHIK
jgi:hypothetical protein